MKAIYNLVIILFTGLIHIVSPFNRKAFLWIIGRKNWPEKLKDGFSSADKTIWIHCASLGEFEQGSPVIEKIKEKTPEAKILVTFFSPSGYEIRKSWPLADYICYLPADTPGNAARFIDIVRPSKVLFIKYEFWNNYISEVRKREIPIYLVSAIFRREHIFFKWYGGFFRKILKKFTHIFVQDENSMELLQAINIKDITISGDTRVDRVVQITERAEEIPQLVQFRGAEKMFLAGSSWKKDEEIIAQYINRYPDRMKWVFAPHEVDKQNIERIEKLLNVKNVRFSQFNDVSADARVLIMDNIGMLSSAYRYAYIAAIGGGFGNGIHNILEPASWGIPVLFGPNHKMFREATDLIGEGGAMTFDSFRRFSDIIDKWINDEKLYLRSAKSASDYINKNTGATGRILQEILRNDIGELQFR